MERVKGLKVMRQARKRLKVQMKRKVNSRRYKIFNLFKILKRKGVNIRALGRGLGVPRFCTVWLDEVGKYV